MAVRDESISVKQYRAPIAVALTGASGVQYGLRLVECLIAAEHEVYVMVSKAAHRVIAVETEIELPAQPDRLARDLTKRFGAGEGQVRCFGREDWMAPVASGSGAWQALVVCPCSTGTLSAVVCGASNNLIERAADVALKERRKLILVPRETPLSAVHLDNMLKLTNMGGVILPAAPGFYHRPDSVQAMIDFVVARILNQLGIAQTLMPRWGD
ncbi:flavin prenyltransferase UbiX [Salinicola acroporae]|uniref:Flavin prenyltransferase UbiX n=1 Tax=Salinicola acroporae TaxID=1541440 RepID=A0ABT6I5M8_9GAMM|nr:flavin prenyltransferase UbiX [Salinicola acroporae]MDH4572977.1 aromatic acid decarboxylase [Salinicola acroporae]